MRSQLIEQHENYGTDWIISLDGTPNPSRESSASFGSDKESAMISQALLNANPDVPLRELLDCPHWTIAVGGACGKCVRCILRGAI